MEYLLNELSIENVNPSELYLYILVDKFLSSHIRELLFLTKNGQNRILYVRDHSFLVLPNIPVSFKNVSRGRFFGN